MLQGHVLSPFLFTVSATDFEFNFKSCYIQKLANEMAIVNCIRAGQEEKTDPGLCGMVRFQQLPT